MGYKKGDTVTIYQDPITEHYVDGIADLMERVPYQDKQMEQWKVRFCDDGMETYRLIKKPPSKL